MARMKSDLINRSDYFGQVGTGFCGRSHMVIVKVKRGALRILPMQTSIILVAGLKSGFLLQFVFQFRRNNIFLTRFERSEKRAGKDLFSLSDSGSTHSSSWGSSSTT